MTSISFLALASTLLAGHLATALDANRGRSLDLIRNIGLYGVEFSQHIAFTTVVVLYQHW